MGIGGNNTREVCNELDSTDLSGVSGILSVSPAYNKPTQEGIYQHYKAISQATDREIILYNVPGRTSKNVVAETTVRCAEDFKNIVAVKEASGDLEQVMSILQNRPDGFEVLSGDDALTLAMIGCGADGVISVVGNAFPQVFSKMVHAALDSNMAEARTQHYQLFEMIDWLFVDGNPAGIKEVLKYLNICHNYVRLPLVPVGKQVSDKLYALIADSGLAME